MLLYVKETFWVPKQASTLGDVEPHQVIFHADLRADDNPAKDGLVKVSPIFMPKRLARLWLEVMEVRGERLQEISTEDQISEGNRTTLRGHDAACYLQEHFQTLWDGINGKKPGSAWQDNPPVWAYSFKRVER